MDNNRSTATERTPLTYCVEGLSAREELMFKAIVRLLNHSTQNQWTYHPAAADKRIDVLVVADGVQPTCSQTPPQLPQPVLRIGHGGTHAHGYLSLPFRPDVLLEELDRLGELTASQRSTESLQALTNAAASVPQAVGTPGQLLRLLRWPPARLLAGTGRMRLATLLTARGMSLDELVYRTSLPLPVCQSFIDDLQRAQLLVISHAAPQPVKPPAVVMPTVKQFSLFDRIRFSLGIKSASSR